MARPYEAIDALITGGQRQEAITLARRVGEEALSAGNFTIARRIGALLERLRDHRFSAHLLSVSMRRLEPPSALPEWDGSDLGTRTLLVQSRTKHVGAEIRYSRLVAAAARRARRCIVLVEPRLVPLFRRSFPQVDVLTSGLDNAEAYGRADVVASYETLIELIGVNGDGTIVELPPLIPDPKRVALFRSQYRRHSPIIGICWYSTNDKKDLPRLDDWAAFLGQRNASYVSIQYGDASADLAWLKAASGVDIIHDPSVDSLVDLDLFAAQVGALDRVVTISNTGAHMAGALGIPMSVLLDDKDHLTWPLEGQTSDWYPSATLHRKANRRWLDVFGDVATDLRRDLPAQSST